MASHSSPSVLVPLTPVRPTTDDVAQLAADRLASVAEAFVWLRLYLDSVGPLQPSDPIWWTLRRRRQGTAELAHRPLDYDALRAVLRRANEVLGTNWTMHDLRHTCAETPQHVILVDAG